MHEHLPLWFLLPFDGAALVGFGWFLSLILGIRWTICLTGVVLVAMLVLTGYWKVLLAAIGVIAAALIIMAWLVAPYDPPHIIDGETG